MVIKSIIKRVTWQETSYYLWARKSCDSHSISHTPTNSVHTEKMICIWSSLWVSAETSVYFCRSFHIRVCPPNCCKRKPDLSGSSTINVFHHNPVYEVKVKLSLPEQSGLFSPAGISPRFIRERLHWCNLCSTCSDNAWGQRYLVATSRNVCSINTREQLHLMKSIPFIRLLKKKKEFWTLLFQSLCMYRNRYIHRIKINKYFEYTSVLVLWELKEEMKVLGISEHFSQELDFDRGALHFIQNDGK